MNSTDCEEYAGAVGAYGWHWNPRTPGWYSEQCKVCWEPNAQSHCDCSASTRASAATAGVLGGARDTVPADPATYSFAAPGFDDSQWQVVDAPHDAVLFQSNWSSTCDESHGYMCRPVAWYRKHAVLPAAWRGQSVRLVFGAVMQRAEVFVQGVRVGTNELGYTPFEFAIDQALPSGTGDMDVVVAIRADMRWGSGHWYEGGGLWSPEIRLEASSAPRIVRDGVYAPPQASTDTVAVTADVAWDEATPGADPTAQVSVRFTLTSEAPSALPADVASALPLGGATGATLAQITSAAQTITRGGTVTASAELKLSSPLTRWSVRDPKLYGLAAELLLGGGDGTVVDTAPASAYASKYVNWTADSGFYLNGQATTLQGFCDHDNTVGSGSAVPARVNLLRSQAMRAMGATHRRFSHNPPDAALPPIMSRIGVNTMSENRDYGLDRYVPFVTAFANRDRNEASVAFWSVCNEVECFATRNSTPAAITKAFREADPSRLVGANVFPVPNSQQAMYDSLEIQGLSHQKQQVFDQFHSEYQSKPIIASESSSCLTQLSEPVVNQTGGVFFDNFNQPCGLQDFLKSGNLTWNAGVAGVWTATDYIGESGGWPHVSSSFGQLTLDVLPKPAAFWYATRFLATADPAWRPPVSQEHTIRIVDDWAVAPNGVGAPSSIRVFASSPSVQLRVNGKTVGWQPVSPVANYSEFTGVPFEAGTLEAFAADEAGKPLTPSVSHSRTTPGHASAIQLVVAAPSPITGTGRAAEAALVADGRDAALVHAFVVDAAGTRVLFGDEASAEITFEVASGPGRIVGTGSANPTQAHSPPSLPTQPAYHGTASAIVGVTVDAVTPTRGQAALIDADTGKGPFAAKIISPGTAWTPEPIVITASAPGLGNATISVPVSTDWAKHSVLAVAAANAGTSPENLISLNGFAKGL